MGIVSGFIKTKRYRKLADNSYQLQSEWASSDTIEMPDGSTLTGAIKSHPQNASDITGGTLGGQVSAINNTNYTNNQIRNTVFLPTEQDPGANVSTSYANGSIICVYE